MADVGLWSLRLAFPLAAVAAASLLGGAWLQRPAWVALGRRAAGAAFSLIALAAAALLWSFLADDFSLRYVAERSRSDQPLLYKAGAFWGGQEGSLLLWLLVMTGYGAYLALRFRPEQGAESAATPAAAARARREARLTALATGLLWSLALFFHLLLLAVADPFARLSPPPLQGRGLNPLLQDPYMLAHPVFLYLGYIGFSVPYSFAMAALLLGEAGDFWLRVTRRWSVTAWMLLSVGILLGAVWAYHVLGWGGYWGWDPVENASLVPWLIATAFIHSAMVQERRGMLKAWNVGLVAATFLLTIFGTFLVRSGILASVHAFAESEVGPWFIVYLSLLLSGTLALASWRAPLLRDERRIEHPLSRESGFLANNVVLVAAAAAVLLGTTLPLFSRALGAEITVGAPYFNRVTGPLFLILLLLMGVGPVLAWRRSTWLTLRRRFAGPAAGAALAALGMLAAGVRSASVLFGLGGAIFVVWTAAAEVGMAARARAELTGEPPRIALPNLLLRNPRRYGGYLVHVAIACIAVGVVASQAYQTEVTRAVRRGESLAVGPYELLYRGLWQRDEGGARVVFADLELRRDGRRVGEMEATKRFHPGWSEAQGPLTPAAVRTVGFEDLYVVLGGWEQGGQIAVFQVYLNPLVPLIWGGGLLLVAGTAYALWPRPARASHRPREEAALRDLADLEYDFRLGKLSAAEYRDQKAMLSGQAQAEIARREAAEAAVRRELAAGGVG